MEPTSSRDRCSATCRWRSACRRIIRCGRSAGSPIARWSGSRRASATLYVNFGRPSIPPEKLLRALLLQALYTIRSERQLMEQLDYNLLFRWFVGLGHGRRRVVADDVHARIATACSTATSPRRFFDAVLIHADTARLLSDEHFTVDGTLLEAWASQKSFRPRDQDPPAPGGGNPTVNFHGQRRRNATHQSTTDPDARLYKKARGREARLGYLGHVLMEHRSGLIVNATVTPADGLRRTRCRAGDDRSASRAAIGSRSPPTRRYDTRDFVAELRAMARHAARGATHDDAPAQCHRWPDDAPSRLRDQSAETETRRARLRLDENDRRPAEAPPPRRAAGDLDLHLHRRGLQHRPDAPVAGRAAA